MAQARACAMFFELKFDGVNTMDYKSKRRELIKAQAGYHPDRNPDSNDLFVAIGQEIEKYDLLLSELANFPQYAKQLDKVIAKIESLIKDFEAKPKPKPKPVTQPVQPKPTRPKPTTPKQQPAAQPQSAQAQQSAQPVQAPNTIYQQLDQILSYLSQTLFGCEPECMIVLENNKGMLGSITRNQNWQSVKGGKAYTLKLNPTYFNTRPLSDVFNVIAHELCHKWETENGGSGLGGYHSKAWEQKAVSIGLNPTFLGNRHHCNTELVPGGLTEQAYKAFIAQHSGFALDWYQVGQVNGSNGNTNGTNGTIKSKQKFTCTSCGQNAWGKPGLRLVCGACYDAQGRVFFMVEN